MLHSYTFVLPVSCWDILTPNPSCLTQIEYRTFFSTKRYPLWIEKKTHFRHIELPCVLLKCVFVAHLVLTLNFRKLMNSPATSLCQQCSNQACLWHQQNCPNAFSSNGCHSIGDHCTWACNEPKGDAWRWEKNGGEQRSAVCEERENFQERRSLGTCWDVSTNNVILMVLCGTWERVTYLWISLRWYRALQHVQGAAYCFLCHLWRTWFLVSLQN